MRVRRLPSRGGRPQCSRDAGCLHVLRGPSRSHFLDTQPRPPTAPHRGWRSSSQSPQTPRSWGARPQVPTPRPVGTTALSSPSSCLSVALGSASCPVNSELCSSLNEAAAAAGTCGLCARVHRPQPPCSCDTRWECDSSASADVCSSDGERTCDTSSPTATSAARGGGVGGATCTRRLRRSAGGAAAPAASGVCAHTGRVRARKARVPQECGAARCQGPSAVKSLP